MLLGQTCGNGTMWAKVSGTDTHSGLACALFTMSKFTCLDQASFYICRALQDFAV